MPLCVNDNEMFSVSKDLCSKKGLKVLERIQLLSICVHSFLITNELSHSTISPYSSSILIAEPSSLSYTLNDKSPNLISRLSWYDIQSSSAENSLSLLSNAKGAKITNQRLSHEK